ncbi:MAG: GyrI-like domain-containing protein, partial [Hyphomonadaceae bacterium]
MRGIARILLILVVVLVVIGVAGYFLMPPTASRTQTFTIDRPPAAVFARLATAPEGFQLAEGVTQTRVVSASDNTVVADVAFADGSTGTATYTIEPEGNGSEVSLRIEQALGPNPLDRVQALTGGEVGPVVEAASTAVTADLNELGTFNFSGLAYEIVQVDARPFLFVTGSVPSDAEAIREGVAQSMVLVAPILARYRLQQDGPPMAVETGWTEGPDGRYSFEAGVPYRGEAPRVLVGVANGVTPAGTAIRVRFQGPEENVIPTYDQMESMISAARLTRGRSFEIYHDDPAQAGGSVDREIYYLVTGDVTRLAQVAPSAAVTAPAPVAPAAPAGAAEATPQATPAPPAAGETPADTPAPI